MYYHIFAKFIFLLSITSSLNTMFRHPFDTPFGNMLGTAVPVDTTDQPKNFHIGERFYRSLYRWLPIPSQLETIKMRALRMKDDRPQTISELHICTWAHHRKYTSMGSIEEALKEETLKKPSFSLKPPSRFAINPQQEAAKVLAVERFFAQKGYIAFYHGVCGEYALYLELNKRLHDLQSQRKTPDCWQYLRAPGKRAFANKINAQTFVPKGLDESEANRSFLLATNYSPFVGLYSYYNEGPAKGWLYNSFIPTLTAPNLSIYNRMLRMLRELVESYGSSLAAEQIKEALDQFNPSRGLLLQILIHESLVNQIAYPAEAFGLRRFGTKTITQDRKDILQTTTHEADCQVSSLNAYYPLCFTDEACSKQTRIIIKPSYFDQPHPKIKIIVWHPLTKREHEELHQATDTLFQQAKARLPQPVDLEDTVDHKDS